MTNLIRQSEVLKIVGLSRSSIWRLEQQGKFPQRVKIGDRAVAWDKSEIDNWFKIKKLTRKSING